MRQKTDLGQFISEQKQKHALQSQELSEKLGISLGYLSQLEHGKRQCPNVSLIKKMVEVFELNMKETHILYDLYEEASGQISPDIIEYIKSNSIIKEVLRCARNAGATENDWRKIIEFLKNEQ